MKNIVRDVILKSRAKGSSKAYILKTLPTLRSTKTRRVIGPLPLSFMCRKWSGDHFSSAMID